MKSFSVLTATFAVSLLALSAWSCAQAPYQTLEFDEVTIEMGGKAYQLEYANTQEQRAMGLMFREQMCADCGMLFKFEPAKQASMWMKNTFIPLDVAFIDRNGVITDIKPLNPEELKSVGASKVVTYALEMNRGWFAGHDIHVGDQIIVNP